MKKIKRHRYPDPSFCTVRHVDLDLLEAELKTVSEYDHMKEQKERILKEQRRPWDDIVTSAKDAARYRWIKQHARHIEIQTLTQLFGMGPTDLDRVIDTAMNDKPRDIQSER